MQGSAAHHGARVRRSSEEIVHFEQRDRQRRDGPVGAHRAGGGQPGGIGGVDGKRSPRPSGTAPTTAPRPRGVAEHNAADRRRWRNGDGEVVQTDGADPRIVEPHRRDHRHHRRHRLPDQHPARSTPRWRRHAPASRAAVSRWWLARCARWRSAAPAAARDQGSSAAASAGRGRRRHRAGGHHHGGDRRRPRSASTSCSARSPAAREQRSAWRRSAQAVQELDRMTQQNAALVEQTPPPRRR